LYGTLLSASPATEAADLYVYRLAEAKAAQIGQVSRILKENAVDCLLNIDQTKFSQEVIRRHNHGKDVTVQQVLADGTVLKQYAIGDRPFSFVCDYRASCEYKCINDDGVGKMKVNDDTYSEPFIIMNADQIMQRIRDLFKSQHFYTRRTLLNHLIGHPREQVDVALTRMIADNGEHLVDKYGRTGRLINVGEYYLFQPSEITDPRIGIYERSAPLQFKRDHVSFPLKNGTLERLAEKHGFAKPKAIAAAAAASAAVPTQVQDMKKAYHEITTGVAVARPDKTTKTWNELCRDVIRELSETQAIDPIVLKRCVVEHFVEELMVSSYDIGLQYVNALYAHAHAPDGDDFDRFAREYFDGQILQNVKYAGEEGILLTNPIHKNGMQLIVRKNAASLWGAAKSAEVWLPYMESIAAMLPRETNLAHIIGFIAEFKEKNGGSYAVFKIKYVQEKGVGARCDQISSKQRRLTIVNQIMHGLSDATPPMYTMEGTKDQNTARFCILPELLLRSYNMMRKDGKHWFLTPVQALRSSSKAQ
jgi:hypothetical protein